VKWSTTYCVVTFLVLLLFEEFAMNLPMLSISALCVAAISTSIYANDTVLPTLKLMAEPELRQETGVVAYQQDEKKRRALQHQVLRKERDIQNFVVDSQIVMNYDYEPKPPAPDMNSLPPFLQQHVMSIANGLQSSDPTEGLYIMLQPFGINRDNINDIRNGGLEIHINQNFLNSMQQNQQSKPPRMQ
jgi:hypothetical protein